MDLATQNNEEQSCTIFSIGCGNVERKFYLELAKEKGITVRTDKNDCSAIHFKGEQKKLYDFIEASGLAMTILKRRQKQIVAEAMIYAGSTDTAWMYSANLVEVWIEAALKSSKRQFKQYKRIRKALKKRSRNAELDAGLFLGRIPELEESE